MSREQVLAWAREAGIITNSPYLMPHDREMHGINRFAALVAAAERESCAKLCEDKHHEWRFGDGEDSTSGPKECAAAIRARGQS